MGAKAPTRPLMNISFTKVDIPALTTGAGSGILSATIGYHFTDWQSWVIFVFMFAAFKVGIYRQRRWPR